MEGSMMEIGKWESLLGLVRKYTLMESTNKGIGIRGSLLKDVITYQINVYIVPPSGFLE